MPETVVSRNLNCAMACQYDYLSKLETFLYFEHEARQPYDSHVTSVAQPKVVFRLLGVTPEKVNTTHSSLFFHRVKSALSRRRQI